MTLRHDLIKLAHQRPDLRPYLLPLLKSARLSEVNVWAMIEGLGWGRKTTDHRKLKAELMSKLTADQAEEFGKIVSRLEGTLGRAITKWSRDNDVEFDLGGDSWGDMLAHIVGLGRREYMATLKDPSRAYERAQKGDFAESFDYVIPYKADYQKAKPSTGGGTQTEPVHIKDLPSDLQRELRIQVDATEAALTSLSSSYERLQSSLTGLYKWYENAREYVKRIADPVLGVDEIIWFSEPYANRYQIAKEWAELQKKLADVPKDIERYRREM